MSGPDAYTITLPNGDTVTYSNSDAYRNGRTDALANGISVARAFQEHLAKLQPDCVAAAAIIAKSHASAYDDFIAALRPAHPAPDEHLDDVGE